MDRADLEDINNITHEELVNELLINMSKLLAENSVLSLKLKKVINLLENKLN